MYNPFGNTIQFPAQLLEDLPADTPIPPLSAAWQAGREDALRSLDYYIFDNQILQPFYEHGYRYGEAERKYAEELRTRPGARAVTEKLIEDLKQVPPPTRLNRLKENLTQTLDWLARRSPSPLQVYLEKEATK